MNDDMIFESTSGTMKLILSSSLYCQMVTQCEKSLPLETGGILIGHYTDNLSCAEITKVVGITPKSKRNFFSFFRSNAGLIDILDNEWEYGNFYLGEWHFHPNCSPSPSGTDTKQMFKISKHVKLHCPEPILVIIGGNKAGWSISAHVVKDGFISLLPINQLGYMSS